MMIFAMIVYHIASVPCTVHFVFSHIKKDLFVKKKNNDLEPEP